MSRFSTHLRSPSVRSAGFTLIEAMIVVVVIAILVAVAIPSYRDYIIRANRSAAQQFMLSIANRQEQYRLDARSYALNLGAVACGLNLTAPAELATRYSFSITNPSGNCPNATDYLITATAIGPQATDGDLTLDNQSVKSPAAKWK